MFHAFKIMSTMGVISRRWTIQVAMRLGDPPLPSVVTSIEDVVSASRVGRARAGVHDRVWGLWQQGTKHGRLCVSEPQRG